MQIKKINKKAKQSFCYISVVELGCLFNIFFLLQTNDMFLEMDQKPSFFRHGINMTGGIEKGFLTYF